MHGAILRCSFVLLFNFLENRRDFASVWVCHALFTDVEMLRLKRKKLKPFTSFRSLLSTQPRSQGLFSSLPLERERERRDQKSGKKRLKSNPVFALSFFLCAVFWITVVHLKIKMNLQDRHISDSVTHCNQMETTSKATKKMATYRNALVEG